MGPPSGRNSDEIGCASEQMKFFTPQAMSPSPEKYVKGTSGMSSSTAIKQIKQEKPPHVPQN